MKIIKIVAIRCQILRLKCTKFNFGWGSTPDPAEGAYSAPPGPLAGFKGPTSKGREGPPHCFFDKSNPVHGPVFSVVYAPLGSIKSEVVLDSLCRMRDVLQTGPSGRQYSYCR